MRDYMDKLMAGYMKEKFRYTVDGGEIWIEWSTYLGSADNIRRRRETAD